MTSVIEVAQDFKELAKFIAELNNNKAFHIGYCGQKVEEIYETLKEDFVEEGGKSTFLVARNSNGEIEAAIGLDIDEETAEVWGPFNTSPSSNIQNQLWERLLQKYPAFMTFYFFLNKENVKQQDFMDNICAAKTGEHLILELGKQNFVEVPVIKSEQFIKSEFQAFKKLHEEAFPNTSYNAEPLVRSFHD